MKSGRYIGVMSGTSMDGVDVILAEMSDKVVTQQESYSHPFPQELKQKIAFYLSGAADNVIYGGKI